MCGGVVVISKGGVKGKGSRGYDPFKVLVKEGSYLEISLVS